MKPHEREDTMSCQAFKITFEKAQALSQHHVRQQRTASEFCNAHRNRGDKVTRTKDGEISIRLSGGGIIVFNP
jgi:hypothetical protein